jgi:hypothetical protein
MEGGNCLISAMAFGLGSKFVDYDAGNQATEAD